MAPRKGKTYRTSSGQQVDFGALLLANETAPALGNMNVNARGDEIAPDGSITKSREEIMREYNELNTMVPSDDAIPQGTGLDADDDWQDWEPNVQPTNFETPEEVPATEVTSQGQEDTEAAVAPAGTNIGQQIEKEATEQQKQKTPSGGLAAAVAAAKKPANNVKQSAQAQEKLTPGVRRI